MASSKLVEKALLLQTLEDAVGKHKITIFAPRNEALERDLDPKFKRFLLEPENRRCRNSHHPDAVIRPDGVIHGIERLLVPRSVQEDFNRRRNLRSISAVLPEGAPEVDPRTNRLKKPATPVSTGLPPVLPIFDAMAPGPSLAPAPAPAPGPGGPHHHFDGESQMLVSSLGDESSMVREASMAAFKDIVIAGIHFWFWIVTLLFLEFRKYFSDSETWLAKFTKIATSEIISSKELNGVWQRAAAGLLVSIGSHVPDLVFWLLLVKLAIF
ncbi:hypothetical protein HHK36_021093 [Tetracentron sinense]|uniref:FAS1 domain-containing protein n=1 Tax=Tetracentron sinense TaxID=13715 RepID=A0A835DAB7_TETSI|nr:hypothetical protein HHK36_021093 [Tetracentron sinense]